MRKFIKKYLHKVVSVVCVLAICLLTAYYNLPVFASDSGNGGVYPISTYQAISKLSEISDLSMYECIQLFDWFEYEEYYFVVANAKNTDSHENQFDFWFDKNHTLQYTHWLNGEISYCSVEDSLRRGGAGGRVRGGTVTGSEFKDINSTADYNSRYGPKETISMYKHSWRSTYKQSALWHYVNTYEIDPETGKRIEHQYNTGFYPPAPIYDEYKTWGNKGWDDCYLIVFVKNEDYTYYGGYYYHCYFTRAGGVNYFNCDVYSLKTGKLIEYNKNELQGGIKYIGASYYPYTVEKNLASPQFYGYSNWTDFDNNCQNKSVDGYLNYDDRRYKLFGSSSNVTVGGTTASNMYPNDPVAYENYVPLRNLITSFEFDPINNPDDDWGYYLSDEPFELAANSQPPDFSNIPDNYYITINNDGDTIYDYSITNPDTDETSTLREYIINNYSFNININNPDNPGGGSVSGNVTVGGSVTVGGQIDIKADPIDINVNVSGGSSGNDSGVVSPDISDTVNYLPENTKTMKNYFSVFFDFLPPEMLALLLGGIACAILCRALGR